VNARFVLLGTWGAGRYFADSGPYETIHT
jgi:hypothetical protein